MLLVTDHRSLARALEKVSSSDAEPAPALELEAAAAPALPTGLGPLDTFLGGGLPRGKIVELAGAWSSGKTTVALHAAARATAGGGLVAWIDPRRELYPPAAAALGVDLGRLLWIRPPPLASAIARAGEIVARSRAFTLVVLDLPPGVRVDDATAGRVRAAAHDASAAVLALAPVSCVAAASLKLSVTAHEDDAGRRLAIASRKGGAVEIALDRAGRYFSAATHDALAGAELPPIVRRPRPPR